MEETKLQTMLLRSQSERRAFAASSIGTTATGSNSSTTSLSLPYLSSPSPVPSSPLRLFDCFEVLDSTSSSSSSLTNAGTVSDWTLFSIFVEEALEQVQGLVDSLYLRTGLKGESERDRVKKTEDIVKNTLTAGEVSLLLQTMHSTGKF